MVQLLSMKHLHLVLIIYILLETVDGVGGLLVFFYLHMVLERFY